MSFKATVDAQCPTGCALIETQVWSFVRGDQDENLRDRLLVGELNLALCGECGTHFTPDATVVYLDPRAELLAFSFPKSFEPEVEKWRAKMADDYRQMREAFDDELPIDLEPTCLFGLDTLSELLRQDDSLENEVLVAGHYCSELSLDVFVVDRAFARARALPRIIPLAGGKKFTRESALRGVEALLAANDRLVSFKGWLDYLASSESDPPQGKL